MLNSNNNPADNNADDPDSGPGPGTAHTQETYRRDLPWAAGFLIIPCIYFAYTAEMVLRRFQHGEPLIAVDFATRYGNFLLIAVLAMFVPHLLGMRSHRRTSLMMPGDVVGLVITIVIAVACLKLDVLGTRQKYHILDREGYVQCLYYPGRSTSDALWFIKEEYYLARGDEICAKAREYFSPQIASDKLTDSIADFKIDAFKQNKLKIDIYN